MFILSYLYLILSKCVYKDGNIYEQILDSLDQYKTNTDFLNAKNRNCDHLDCLKYTKCKKIYHIRYCY